MLPLKCEVLCLQTCEVLDTVIHGEWSCRGGKPEGTRPHRMCKPATALGIVRVFPSSRAFNMKDFDLPGTRGTKCVDLTQVFRLLTGCEALELKTAK